MSGSEFSWAWSLADQRIRWPCPSPGSEGGREAGCRSPPTETCFRHLLTHSFASRTAAQVSYFD